VVNNLDMNKPLISVILPVYNAELYVSESIQSVLNQSFSDFELIILNDGSTDGSERVILEFQDKRIKYVKNETNLKLIDTLNLGLKLVQGKYIARMDADDIAFPDRFEKQITFLEKNPDYGLVGSFAECFGDTNGIMKYVEEDQDIRFALLTHNPFIHSTIMVRSTVLKENNLAYKKDKLHVEDYDLWIQLLAFTKAKLIPECLIKYRVHENQVSNVHREMQKLNAENLQKAYFNFVFKGISNLYEMRSIFYDKFFNEQILLFVENRKKIKISLSNEIQKRVFKTIDIKSRDAYLTKEKVGLKELFSTILFNNFFTLKQRTVLIFKLF
jgi:glycosyltransferase involved in cell wall biosynthesis